MRAELGLGPVSRSRVHAVLIEDEEHPFLKMMKEGPSRTRAGAPW